MAGFQVSTHGRFWVSTEVKRGDRTWLVRVPLGRDAMAAILAVELVRCVEGVRGAKGYAGSRSC